MQVTDRPRGGRVAQSEPGTPEGEMGAPEMVAAPGGGAVVLVVLWIGSGLPLPRGVRASRLPSGPIRASALALRKPHGSCVELDIIVSVFDRFVTHTGFGWAVNIRFIEYWRRESDHMRAPTTKIKEQLLHSAGARLDLKDTMHLLRN